MVVGRRSTGKSATIEAPTSKAKAKSKQESPMGTELREEEEEEDDDEEESESDGEPIVMMISGREKRVNAGNRMRGLLDEESSLLVEEEFKEEVDDVEFVSKEEEDVFDSDFGSTDEDVEEEDDERRIEREAKEARREARGKKRKSTHTPFLPTFARQTKASRNATGSSSRDTLDDAPVKRKRITHVLPEGTVARESSRKSAVAFKHTVEERLKKTESKKRLINRPPKRVARVLTQADLISEALETEDINRASLLAFYAAEEDRLNNERLMGMRHEITGPKITFLSRSEGGGRGTGSAVMGIAEAKGKAKEVVENVGQRAERGRRRLIEVIGEAGKQGWRSGIDPVKEAGAVSSSIIAPPPTSASASTTVNGDCLASNSSLVFPALASSSHGAPGPPSSNQLSPTISRILLDLDDQSVPSPWFAPPSSISTADLNASPVAPSSNAIGAPSSSLSAVVPSFPSGTPSSSALALDYDAMPTGAAMDGTPEPPSHTRNYLIVTDFQGSQDGQMKAIFGDQHSISIPAQKEPGASVCAITGLPALYLDPRTLTPYATISAYATLTSLLNGDYRIDEYAGVWSTASIGLNALVEAHRIKRDALFIPPPHVVAAIPGVKGKTGNGGGPGSGSGRPRKWPLLDSGSQSPALTRSPSLPSILPPLPTQTPGGAMMTTMLDGQTVLGAGGLARAKKNLERQERERVEAELAALQG